MGPPTTRPSGGPMTTAAHTPPPAHPPPLDPSCFPEALASEPLASEGRRATLVAATLGFICVLYLVLIAVAPEFVDIIGGRRLAALVLRLLLPAIAFELLLRWYFGWCHRTGRRVAEATLYGVAFAEGSFPTLV